MQLHQKLVFPKRMQLER